MADSSGQHTQFALHPQGHLTRLQIVGGILRWLVSVILPTEDDLIEAGVFLGPMHD